MFGDTRIRTTLTGDVALVQVLIDHPMETGSAVDAKTGKPRPAHFIQSVNATFNGKTVFAAEWGTAISRNPLVGFKVKGAKAGDAVTVSWADNQGKSNSASAKI